MHAIHECSVSNFFCSETLLRKDLLPKTGNEEAISSSHFPVDSHSNHFILSKWKLTLLSCVGIAGKPIVYGMPLHFYLQLIRISLEFRCEQTFTTSMQYVQHSATTYMVAMVNVWESETKKLHWWWSLIQVVFIIFQNKQTILFGHNSCIYSTQHRDFFYFPLSDSKFGSLHLKEMQGNSKIQFEGPN